MGLDAVRRTRCWAATPPTPPRWGSGFARGWCGRGTWAFAIEGGANLHNVPASQVLFGFHQHLAFELTAPLGRFLPFAVAGAGLNEFPAKQETDPLLMGRCGLELALGHVRPALDVTVVRASVGSGLRDEIDLMVSLGAGYVFE